MAYKYQYNPGVQDNHSLKSVRNGRSASRNGTLIRAESTYTTTRHRKVDDSEMGGGARCCFGFLMLIAQVLLHGAVALVLYWVWMFHKPEGASSPFAWRENPAVEFNLHPVLMIIGFIYFMGQAMLMFRSCRCCNRICNKLLHATFHLTAVPCIVVGFIAVLDSHDLRKDQNGLPDPIPNFYSLHSWMGLATMGLFALQFVVGFFSFLVLLCCESATASFRASLVPIHSAFGIATFVMAVATACAGLTEKAFFSLSIGYSKWVDYLNDPRFRADTAFEGLDLASDQYTEETFVESLVINTLGAALVALVIVVAVLVLHPRFKYRPQRIITVTSTAPPDRYA